MTRQVGVDIGATAVRAVEVTGLSTDSLAQVSKVNMVPLPPGAMSSGRVRDPAAVGYALRQALREARMSPYGVVVGLASPEAAIARISLPASLRRGEWAQVIRLQDKSVSPRIPIAESALSLHPLDEDPVNGTRTLLAAATLNTEVAALADACRQARVTPRAVDLSGAATMRCMTRAVPGNEDVATLVDIGSSKVSVATRQGLHLRAVRTVDTGGEAITRAIMGGTGMSFDEAERRKRAMRLGAGVATTSAAMAEQLYGMLEESRVQATPGTPDALAAQALYTATDALIDQVALAVESDADRHPAAPTQGLVLCGGGALLQGLKERLTERVGVPVVLGRPWATLTSPRAVTGALAEVDEASLMLSLATAIGLAMWEGR